MEHAFGRLKGRFPILRALPSRDMRRAFHLIESLMILHNILEERGDDPTTIAGFNGKAREDEEEGLDNDDTDDDEEHHDDADELYYMGRERRKQLVQLMVSQDAE